MTSSANVEFKAELREPSVARTVLRSLGFERVGVLKQTDTYYRVITGRLKRRETSWAHDDPGAEPVPHDPNEGDARAGAEVEYIRYHRPDQAGSRVSRYERLTEDQYRERFGSTELAEIAVVRKTRELWVRGPVRAHIDTVAGLGRFLEIEVAARRGKEALASEEAEACRAALAPALGELIGTGYLNLIAADDCRSDDSTTG